MLDLLLTLISAAAQLTLAYVGYKVSTERPLHPKRVEATFIAVGFIGLIAIAYSGLRSSAVQDSMHSELDQIYKIEQSAQNDKSDPKHLLHGTVHFKDGAEANIDVKFHTDSCYAVELTTKNASIEETVDAEGIWAQHSLGAASEGAQALGEYRTNRFYFWLHPYMLDAVSYRETDNSKKTAVFNLGPYMRLHGYIDPSTLPDEEYQKFCVR